MDIEERLAALREQSLAAHAHMVALIKESHQLCEGARQQNALDRRCIDASRRQLAECWKVLQLKHE